MTDRKNRFAGRLALAAVAALLGGLAQAADTIKVACCIPCPARWPFPRPRSRTPC